MEILETEKYYSLVFVALFSILEEECNIGNSLNVFFLMFYREVYIRNQSSTRNLGSGYINN